VSSPSPPTLGAVLGFPLVARARRRARIRAAAGLALALLAGAAIGAVAARAPGFGPPE